MMQVLKPLSRGRGFGVRLSRGKARLAPTVAEWQSIVSSYGRQGKRFAPLTATVRSKP